MGEGAGDSEPEPVRLLPFQSDELYPQGRGVDGELVVPLCSTGLGVCVLRHSLKECWQTGPLGGLIPPPAQASWIPASVSQIFMAHKLPRPLLPLH